MALHRGFGERLIPTGEPSVDPVTVREAGGDVPGEDVDLTRRVPERPRRDPHRPPQRHRLHRRGLGDATTPVATDYLEAHLIPPYGTEVQIHVGRVPAPLVQKALEEQPVGERLGLRES